MPLFTSLLLIAEKQKIQMRTLVWSPQHCFIFRKSAVQIYTENLELWIVPPEAIPLIEATITKRSKLQVHYNSWVSQSQISGFHPTVQLELYNPSTLCIVTFLLDVVINIKWHVLSLQKISLVFHKGLVWDVGLLRYLVLSERTPWKYWYSIPSILDVINPAEGMNLIEQILFHSSRQKDYPTQRVNQIWT